jgi:hypothetical protein
MPFLGLITRCKDEFYIKEFCDYYLSQGVDKIFVIDDNSDDKSIYDNINDNRIEIIYEKNLFSKKGQMDVVNKYYKELKHKFKWMISVDVDEFITTKKNITHTIKDELNTTFKDVDCIKIPWVMMSCNSIEKNPNSILLENTYRWNHNKKHPHSIHKFRCRYDQIEVKCIFKTDKFNKIDVHIPSKTVGDCIIVDSIIKKKQKLNSFYNNLREEDIKKGYLLCYHYRIISKENCLNKLNKAQYLKFQLEDLMRSDNPEIIDETLKNKTINKIYSPDIFIIGCQKSGTTTLARILIDHGVFISSGKNTHNYETHFFDRKEIFINDYYNFFKSDKKIKCDKTPNYISLPYAMDRIHKYYPKTKLIVLIREPIQRVISQFFMIFKNKELTYDNYKKIILDEYLSKLNQPIKAGANFIERSKYFKQLSYVFNKFPRENVHIEIYEELVKTPDKYNNILSFIGIDSKIKNIPFENKNIYSKNLDKKIYESMYMLFKEENKKLYSLLGKQIIEWEDFYSRKFKKIFIIGFNRCGTRTLHYFFKDNNLKSIHWDNNNLVDVFENNIKSGNKLLENGKTINKKVNSDCNYSEAIVFSDMTKNIINKDAKDYYKRLDSDYPNSKFILNIRDVDKWIKSRKKHSNGRLLYEHMNFHNCDEKQIEIIWKNMYEKHILDVKDYFENRKLDLCIYDIENDTIDKIIEFLKNDFILNKKYYKHIK